jgi:hypothetical protein
LYRYKEVVEIREKVERAVTAFLTRAQTSAFSTWWGCYKLNVFQSRKIMTV